MLGSSLRALRANFHRWDRPFPRTGCNLPCNINEQRDTLSPRFPDLVNRAFIVKVNRLVRF